MNKKIIPVALLVFALSAILMLGDRGFLIPAYALSFDNVTVASGDKITGTDGSTYYHVVVSAVGSSATWQTFRISDNSLVSTKSIKSLTGNYSTPSTVNSGNNGAVRDMQCTITYCIFMWDASIAQFQKWSISGSPTNYVNESSFSLSAASNSLSEPIKILGGVLYGIATCSATGNRVLYKIALSDLTPLAVFGDCITTNMSTQIGYTITGCVSCGGSPTVNRVAVQMQGSGGQNVYHIWNTDTLGRICASSFTSSTVSNANGLIYLGNTVNKFAMARDANDVITTSVSSCTIVDTITSATMLTGNYIKELSVNTHNNEWYVYSKSASATAQASIMSLSTLNSLTTTLGMAGASMIRHSMFSVNNQNKLFLVDSTTTARMYQLDTASGGNPPESDFVGGVDCSLPANAQTLLCRLHTISANGTALSGATESTTTSLNNLFIQAGLVEEGSDIQTNGVGYFIIAIMLGIMIAMFALASNMELGKIPPFVWMLGAISVVGSGTAFGLVDTTFFIISILIIIALASMKILSAFERF